MADKKADNKKAEEPKKVLVTPVVEAANKNVFEKATNMRLWGFDFAKNGGDLLVCEFSQEDAKSFVEAGRVKIVK